MRSRERRRECTGSGVAEKQNAKQRRCTRQEERKKKLVGSLGSLAACPLDQQTDHTCPSLNESNIHTLTIHATHKRQEASLKICWRRLSVGQAGLPPSTLSSHWSRPLPLPQHQLPPPPAPPRPPTTSTSTHWPLSPLLPLPPLQSLHGERRASWSSVVALTLWTSTIL